MKKTFNLILASVLLGGFVFTGCEKEEEVQPMVEKNIVDVASEAGQFSVLIQAAQKAGLANFLGSQENITVFAPTDDAFTALLSDLGANSLDDIDSGTLENILKYHVVNGKVMSSDLTTGYVSTLAQYSGNYVSMYLNVGNGVAINENVMVTSADIEASNGIIHVVDKVIIPPSVVNIALANSNFTLLVDAVVKAGLVEALNGEGPFTVFAPTNAAFEALFSSLGINGVEDLTKEQLIPILTYHVVSGNVRSEDLNAGEFGTLNPQNKLMVDLSNGLRINDSEVIAADIQGANGVVHVINKVLIPE